MITPTYYKSLEKMNVQIIYKTGLKILMHQTFITGQEIEQTWS